MIYALFEGIYGPATLIVTSEQLTTLGFDDSVEPELQVIMIICNNDE